MSNATLSVPMSVLGPDLSIRGDLTASSDLQIDGKVEGDITCSALVLGEQGVVLGVIRAETARLAGTAKGSVQAASLVIQRTARIEGDVSYGVITVEEGAIIDGKLTPKPNEPKLAIAGGTEA